jgi:CRISPR-associated endonuclease/helicase Cas3
VQGLPTTFWGKLRLPTESAGRAEWHPLGDHCADVAAVCERVLSLEIWARRFRLLAGCDLDAGIRARLCVLAALHDVGKFNLGFQAKARPDPGRTAGHVREGLAAVFHGDALGCLAELGDWGEGACGLLAAALCHHGQPFRVDSVAPYWQSSWWRETRALDPRAGAERLLSRCRDWFPAAFSHGTSQLPAAPTLAHGFAGLVTLADWIASDTRFFPFADQAAGERIVFARERASAALAAIGLESAAASRHDEHGRTPFARITPPGCVPRAAQNAILDLPLDEGTVTVLEAETGSGKTEAALARFVALFDAGLVDGLYFALPTRTAATQMHHRVHEAVQRAFAVPPPVVLAVPGYLRVDDTEGCRLPGFEVRWSDAERCRYRGWAAESAKRYLAATVAVGTIDQVLLSSLMVPHAHLRASALLRHLLVVDEVHASDAYMGRILRDVLARHIAAGGHALLLSATLGGEARASLLHPTGRRRSVSLQDALAVPYPSLTHCGAREWTSAIRSDGRDRGVTMVTEPWMEELEPIATAVAGAAARGAKVLIIRNTVVDCIATQLAVEEAVAKGGDRTTLFACDGVPAPHHSRFARVDREALDAAIEARFGRVRAGAGCVVVATQTVQQSLDLDADALFTDLCPADVLLQRLGRLHRHQRDAARPPGFESPRAVVLVPDRRDLGCLLNLEGMPSGSHGLGSVYEDLRILEATWRLLEQHREWKVPGMNRHLVENSVHSTVLERIAVEGGPRWQRHAEQVTGTALGERRQADLNLVDWSRHYAEMSFPGQTGERIGTRLGEGDRRVVFESAPVGPFGRHVRELVLPAWWVSGVSGDELAATRVMTTQEGFEFEFGGRAFAYGRLGLCRVAKPAGKTEVAEDDGP